MTHLSIPSIPSVRLFRLLCGIGLAVAAYGQCSSTAVNPFNGGKMDCVSNGVSSSQNNTWTQTQDFTGATTLLCNATNATTSTSAGYICYDTTLNQWREVVGGTNYGMAGPLTGSLTDSDVIGYNAATHGLKSLGPSVNGISGQVANQFLLANSATTSNTSGNLKQETTGAVSALQAFSYASATVVTYTNGGTTNLNVSTSNTLSLVIPTSGTTTLAITSPPTNSALFTLYMTQDATTAGAVTYPASFLAPTCAPSKVLGSHTWAVIEYNTVLAKYVTRSCGSDATPGVIVAPEAADPGATGDCGAGNVCIFSNSATHILSYRANGGALTALGASTPTFPANAQTATYQVLAADFSACKEIQVASGTFTITLVANTTQPANGQCLWIVNYGTGVVTVARSGQNINGAASNLTIAAGSASAPNGLFVQSDGTNYFAQPLIGSSTGAVTSVNTLTGAVVLFSPNAQTTTYQALAADFAGCKTITVASGTFTITLVANTSQPASGQCIKVINYGTGVVTIARNGQNINGGTVSMSLPAASATSSTSAFVVSDGTNYFADVTGAPAIANVTGMGTGVGTFLATPSSANLAGALTDETGTGAAVFATSPTLTTPNLGTPSALTLTNATGLPAAQVPAVTVTVTTSSPTTVSTTLPAAVYYNQHATAGTANVYNLPTAAAGKQFCFANSNNGSAADTGTVQLVTSATGQFIIFTDGTLSATGGNVISGGAAGDAGCVVGVDATHWQFYKTSGTWTKN